MTSHKNFRLKIFQRQKKRFAVRLEEVFWQQLDLCAKDSAQDLSKLVFTIFDSEPQARNRTALLRSYCLSWLQNKLTLADLRALPVDLNIVLAACPSPCFIVTPDRQLKAYNNAFAKIMWGHTATHETPSPLHMSFMRPFNTIVEALLKAPGKVIQGQMGFATSGRQMQCRVNFSMLDEQERDAAPILVFIDS